MPFGFYGLPALLLELCTSRCGVKALSPSDVPHLSSAVTPTLAHQTRTQGNRATLALAKPADQPALE